LRQELFGGELGLGELGELPSVAAFVSWETACSRKSTLSLMVCNNWAIVFRRCVVSRSDMEQSSKKGK
jgi:hypothetical protein